MTVETAAWPLVSLGDHATFVMGQAPPGSACNKSGDGTPFVKAGEFAGLRPVIREWTTSPLKMAASSDVLICVVGATAGKLNLGVDAAIGRSVAAIRPKDSLDPRFLYWFLQEHVQALRSGSRGSAQGVISKADLAEIEVPLPHIDEQRRIVDLLEDHLSRIDAAVSSLDAAGRWLLALRRSQLETTKRLASASGRVLSLSQVSIDARYGTSAKCVIDGAGVAVVRIPNLVNGSVDLADEKRVEDPIGDMAGLMLEQGDVLVVRTNGSRDLIGRAAVVQEGVKAAFASYLIRYRVDESQVRPLWVRMMFDAPSTREALESMAASSAGQFNLGLKKLDTVRLPVPLLTVQDDLLASADTTFAALSRLGRQVQDARERAAGLRAALLAAAFSGALSIAPATMELAHV